MGYQFTTAVNGAKYPKAWKTERLRFSVKINPVKSEVAHMPEDTSVSFIAMESIGERGEIHVKIEKPIGDVYGGYTYFIDGDIVIAKITPCFENGKAAIACGLINGVGFGTTELPVIRPSDRIDRRWFLYLATSYHFRELGTSRMYGAGGQKRVPEDFLKDFQVAIPSLPEQQQIADFLDWKTGQIDRLIAKKRVLVSALSEQRMAVITRAVTRGLDPTVPMKNSGSLWLGKIPKHWQIMRFGYQTRVKEGQVDPEIEPYIDQPLIAPNHIERNTGRIFCLETARDQAAISGKYQVSEGDIVYSKIRPHLNKCCLATFHGLCSADMYPIRPSEDMDSQFLLYWILATPFLNYAELNSMRVAMPKLNRETLSAAPIIIPPLVEQIAIRDFLVSETDHIDRLTEKTETAIDRLTEYRTALITAATTGKIDVRNVSIPKSAARETTGR